MEFPGYCGLGERGKPDLWITLTDKAVLPTHLAFRTDRARVDAFHAAALAAGGVDNGPPGLRADYHPHYYAAFVIDPEGNNIEVVCHDPPGMRKPAPERPVRAALPAPAGEEGEEAGAQARQEGGGEDQEAEVAPTPGRSHAGMHARSIVAGALMAATIALPAGVSARPRPRFEPTDLEWESTGVFEVDVEFGLIRGPVERAPDGPRLRARLRHPRQRRVRSRRQLRAGEHGAGLVFVRPSRRRAACGRR